MLDDCDIVVIYNIYVCALGLVRALLYYFYKEIKCSTFTVFVLILYLCLRPYDLIVVSQARCQTHTFDISVTWRTNAILLQKLIVRYVYSKNHEGATLAPLSYFCYDTFKMATITSCEIKIKKQSGMYMGPPYKLYANYHQL